MLPRSFRIRTVIPALLVMASSWAQGPCSGGIDLGPDTTLCTGQTLLLNAGPGYLGYLWDDGSTAATRLVSAAGDYQCTVTQADLGSDLVVNGDFSAGATGFTSGYIPGTGGSWGLLSLEGQYAVAADASTVHDNFPPCTDHTGGGNMMVVNGSATGGVSIWCQTINVAPNTNYAFSAWLSTMVASNPAVLQFSINGQPLGNTFQASITSCQWDQFYEVWSSGTNTTAEICITNQNTAVSGNDFALDDISFTPFCVYTDIISVSYAAYPDPDLGADRVICGEGPVVLDAGAANADTYVWNDGLAQGPQLEVSTSGSYWVNATTASCMGRDTVQITFLPQPEVELGPDIAACAGDSVHLDATSAGASYVWHDGSTAPTWTGWASTEAWVEVTQGPCTATDTVHITVDDCEVVVILPNVFTPNGEEGNDVFTPMVVSGLSTLNVTVYNRWGEKVYGSTAPQFQWDGRTVAGEVVPEGVYFWTLEYQGLEGPVSEHGTVTLLR